MEKLTHLASLTPSSFDETEKSIEVIWTTGATVRRQGRAGVYDEELVVTPQAVRLARLNAGAPLLNTHSDCSLRDIIGAVVPGSARVENGRGVARVRLSAAPGDADVIHKIRDGIIRHISVGYVVHAIERAEQPSGVPIVRCVDWEPMEISAVPIPADAGAQFRAHAAGDREANEAARARMQARAAAAGVRAAPEREELVLRESRFSSLATRY